MREFPRPGAFCVVGGATLAVAALGIVAGLGHQRIVEEPHVVNGVAQTHEDGSPVMVKKNAIDTDAPFAEVHLINAGDDIADGAKHGETMREMKNVPFSDMRQASFEEINQLDRASHLSAEVAARFGYESTEAPVEKVPAPKRHARIAHK